VYHYNENRRKVSKEDINKLIEEYELLSYIETSSKTGFNSKQLFIDVAKTLFKDYSVYRDNPSNSNYSKGSSNLQMNTNKLELLTQKEDSEDSFSTPKKGCC
jgi:hypothetical protein